MAILKSILDFLADDNGATAVEYAVLLMLILLAVIASVALFGERTADNFDESATAIGGAIGN